MILASQTFWVFLSPKWMDSYLLTICEFLDLKTCTVLQWMSLRGTLASVELFIKLGRFHMRPLLFYFKACWSRKTQPCSFIFLISSEIKTDLQWQLSVERLREGKSFLPLCPNLEFYSNASDLGWGALPGSQKVSGMWSVDQRALHTNVKALKAIHLGLQPFLP